MHSIKKEVVIKTEGELHLQHLPFHKGEKVKVTITTPNGNEESIRKEEYDAFMLGYAEEDSVYDKL